MEAVGPCGLNAPEAFAAWLVFSTVILKGPMPFWAFWVWAFRQAREGRQEKILQPLETEPPLLNVEQAELMPTLSPPQ